MKITKPFFYLGSLIIITLLTVSCGALNFAPDPAPTAVLGTESAEPLAGTATTTCSTTCANQGQCGLDTTIENGLQVVLLNNAEPNLDNHTFLLGIGTTVSILASEERTVIPAGNPTAQQQLRFYLVEVDNREPGWVAGWCIQQ